MSATGTPHRRARHSAVVITLTTLTTLATAACTLTAAAAASTSLAHPAPTPGLATAGLATPLGPGSGSTGGVAPGTGATTSGVAAAVGRSLGYEVRTAGASLPVAQVSAMRWQVPGPPALYGRRPAERVGVAAAAGAPVAGRVGGRVLLAAGKPKDLKSVITNLRNLLLGLAVSIAALFFVIAGLLFMVAGGDMRGIETAKGAFKAAVIGLVVAGAATLIVTALQKVVGL